MGLPQLLPKKPLPSVSQRGLKTTNRRQKGIKPRGFDLLNRSGIEAGPPAKSSQAPLRSTTFTAPHLATEDASFREETTVKVCSDFNAPTLDRFRGRESQCEKPLR